MEKKLPCSLARTVVVKRRHALTEMSQDALEKVATRLLKEGYIDVVSNHPQKGSRSNHIIHSVEITDLGVEVVYEKGGVVYGKAPYSMGCSISKVPLCSVCGEDDVHKH